MIDVIFPKRPPTPREREIRPVPSDYHPKQVRAVSTGGAESEAYYEDLAGAALLEGPAINLHRLEDELSRNRLHEIASLVRSLTYGEMIEFARAIWNIRPGGTIDQHSLPMMLHLWSTSGSADVEPSDSKSPDGKASEH